MSDPVSNSEVEDVLSSIRRLVTNTDVSTGTPARPARKAEPSAEVEKLVLTDALRVGPAHDEVPEAGFAEVDTIDDDEGFEFDPEAAAFIRPRPASDDTRPEARDDQVDSPDVMNLGEYKLPDEAVESAAENMAVVDAKEVVFDSVRGDMAEEAAGEDAIIASAQTQAADVMAEPEEDPVEAAQPTEGDKQQDAPKSLGDKIAALEEVISRQTTSWDPDGSEQPGETPEVPRPLGPVWGSVRAKDEDTSSAETVAEPDSAEEATPQAQDDAEMADDAPSDIDVVDEDALRAMVAEIVREELQGDLGERITRNVRKLVRREIQRALTSKELE